MIQGILLAVLAGVMLGFYALPEKFTKEYKYENTWGLYFFIMLLILPILTSLFLIKDFGIVLSSVPTDVLLKMAAASFLWGWGVQLWSKAINYIGLSLGFSIFIGSVILVGSVLPFIVDGLPSPNALIFILIGLAVVLVGIGINGRAGMLRNSDEMKSGVKSVNKMAMGIFIAVLGGLLATGFSFANAIGVSPISEAMLANGNPAGMTSLAIMNIIYVSGGIFVLPYFAIQLTKNNTWHVFKKSFVIRNVSMATIMAVLCFFAGVVFAYAASQLGKAGNTVGYAIYNTISVLVAVISGLLTSEWGSSSSKAKNMLYFALAAMITGVVLIAVGNSFA